MQNNLDRKTNADRILYEYGLMKRLEEIGTPHIIGSYSMDMMAWNDLDIDIENDTMSLDKLYALSAYRQSTNVWLCVFFATCSKTSLSHENSSTVHSFSKKAIVSLMFRDRISISSFQH